MTAPALTPMTEDGSGASTIRLSVPVRPLYAVLDAIGSNCQELLITATAQDDFTLELTGLTSSGTVRIALDGAPPLEGRLRKGQESVLLLPPGIKRLMMALKEEKSTALTLTVKTNGRLSLGVNRHDFKFLPKKTILRPAMTRDNGATFQARPLLRSLEDALGCVSKGLGGWTDGVGVELTGHEVNVSGADSFHMVRSTLQATAHRPQDAVAIHPQVCELAMRLLRLGRPESARPALAAALELQETDTGGADTQLRRPGTQMDSHDLTGAESQRVTLSVSEQQDLAQWSGHAPGMRWSVRGSLLSQRPGPQVAQVCAQGQQGRHVEVEAATLSNGLKISSLINPHEVNLSTKNQQIEIHAAADGSSASVYGGTCSDTLQLTVKPAMLRQGLEIYSRSDRACGPARMQVSPTLISLTSEDQQDTVGSDHRRVQYVSTLIL